MTPNNDAKLFAAFNDCLNFLEGGGTLEDCLGAYPEFADELSPMLQSVGLLQQNPKATPSSQQIERMQEVYLRKVRAP
jgi:hypothetical protein